MKKRILQLTIFFVILALSPVVYVFIKNIQNDLQLREYVSESIIPRIKADFKRLFTFNNTDELNIPIIYLNIPDSELNKLEAMRLKKLENVKLNGNKASQNQWKYVKASLIYNEIEHKIKIRIRGDMKSNYNRGLKNASYRIDIDDDSYLFGKKKLSLVRPFLENNFYSYLFSHFLEHEGFISTDIQFIRLYFNKKDIGLYLIQEGFSKELIESSEYREGVILRFKNDCSDNNGSYNITGFPELEAYRNKKVTKDSAISMIYSRALNKIDLFHDKEIETAQCFNISQFAKYIALCDIFLAHHSSTCHNLKLYFNPVNDKFEPIAWDPSSFVRYKTTLPIHKGFNNYAGEIFDNECSYPIYPILFSDTAFIKDFNQNLYRYITDTSICNFINNTINVLKPLDAELYRQRFQPYFDLNIILGNMKNIQNLLTTDSRLTARYYKDDNILVVKSNIPYTIYLQKVKFDSTNFVVINKTLMPLRSDTIHLSDVNLSKKDNKFTLVSTIYGLDIKQKYKGKIFKKFDNVKSNILNEKVDSNILNINSQTKSISFKSNPTVLTKNLFIPKNYTLNISAGFKLELKNNANIVCESSVNANGKKGLEISIKSDKSGGILIKNTEEKSKFNFVIFENLSNPVDNNWSTTGAITFYEADVHFTNCTIKNNKSEDALNIIRSNFVIDSCTISSTYSDAVDIDFGNGIIKNTTINNTGNDALDFSGSEIKIDNVKLFDINDKAVSSGEKSNVDADNVTVTNAFIGLASKDDSRFIAKNIKVNNTKYTATVYQKKAEFGSSSLEIENGEIDKSNFLIEEKSNFIFNHKKIIGDKKDVYDYLYNEN